MAEIVEALLFLGGGAHRDLVIQRVAAARTENPGPPSDALRAEIQIAFDNRLMLDRASAGRPALFDLPFGAGSRRWALAREAAAFLRQNRNSGAIARIRT